MIGAWLMKRAERKTLARRQAGYNYAAGVMLRTKGDYQTIREMAADCDGVFGGDDFDRGMKDAMFDWCQLADRLRNQKRLEAIVTFARTTPIDSPSAAQWFKSRVEDMARGAS